MQPFLHWSHADSLLIERYPRAQDFARACKTLPVEGQLGVLRSFLAEGIPCAFSATPTLYEAVRAFVAARLGIRPVDLTLVGSARLGYSTAPPPRYGAPFGPSSDLDFAAVSPDLFAGLSDAFFQWKADVEAGRQTVRNAREEMFWRENLSIVPRNIARGFIDSYKVASRYHLPVLVNQTLWLVPAKLVITPGAPRVRRATLRVYRDSDSFFRQQRINLRAALREFPSARGWLDQYLKP